MRLAGDAIDEVGERGERIAGDTLLLLLNADAGPLTFTMPAHAEGQYWEEVADTTNGVGAPAPLHGGDHYQVQDHSMAVFRLSVPRRRRRTDEVGARTAPQVHEPAASALA